MKRIAFVAVILIITILLGCSPKAPVTPPPTQETSSVEIPASTTTPSPAPQETHTPTTLPAPQVTPLSTTLTPVPLTTPTPSPTPAGPYTGPLFDTHLHLAATYLTGWLSRLTSAQDLLSYLDHNQVNWAIGFYTMPPDKTRIQWAKTAETIARDTSKRIIPLFSPCEDPTFAAGQYTGVLFNECLQPQGLFQGVGEIVPYHFQTQNLSFESAPIQTAFKAVNEMRGIIMVHPSNGTGVRTTYIDEVEPSIARYPDTIFLFHAYANFDLAAQLMSKYPNVYFSMDFAGFYYQGKSGTPLFPTNPAAENPESFLAAINEVGFDRIVSENVRRLTPLIQKFPDRVFWGTDLSHPFTFEQPVTDMVIKISRQVIGGLPIDIQEKYAYQNAQRVFGRFLTPKQ
jgi:hypothetical protein